MKTNKDLGQLCLQIFQQNDTNENGIVVFWKKEGIFLYEKKEYKSFFSHRSHLLDIYEIRLEIAQAQKKDFLGLEELVKSLKKTRLKEIKVIDMKKILLFTNAANNRLLGFIWFAEV